MLICAATSESQQNSTSRTNSSLSTTVVAVIVKTCCNVFSHIFHLFPSLKPEEHTSVNKFGSS